MLVRTPRRISPAIASFCNRLVPGVTPVMLECRPRRDGAPSECYDTVNRQVAEFGGSAQHGWAIWEWPDILVEAEFHAVWRSVEGTLVEVTPRTDDEDRILFLPDPRRIYNGTSVDNVRVALRDDPRVHEFIKLAKQRFDILNRGERKHQFGMVSVPEAEIMPVLHRMVQLQNALAKHRPGRNDPCTCGSGDKFKNCHGKAGSPVLG